MKRQALIPLILALVSSIALASVFAYYPLNIKAIPQAPGVFFELGNNAGQPDIGTNNYINVMLGETKTSVTVEIHPTYQDNYYKNITLIVNNDDNAMKVFLIFDSVNNQLPSGSQVKLFVYEDNNKIKDLDITDPSTGSPINIGTINAGSKWQIDFYVKIPEGTDITNKQYQATARLVYTPSTETPPVAPASGR